MRATISRIRFLIPLLGLAAAALADVSTPRLFSDHMVLQCDVPVPVWGRADPGEEITVAFAGQSVATKANPAGRWSLALNRLAAGTQGTLSITGHNRLVIQDVLVGEVWLAAGQSNMQLRVSEAANASEAVAAANLPQIRMFTVPRRPAESAADNCEGHWTVCQPSSVGTFSAVGFYFARELHTTRHTPVGIINASWGATPIEAWTSPEAMQGQAELAPVLAAGSEEGHPTRPGAALPLEQLKNHPGYLFNGMIAPLRPYALRGVIWYQGENNANSAWPELYGLQLPLLIADWRHQWGQARLPFAWVQLPNFQPKRVDPAAPAKWALVREAMLQTLAIPDTGMAVAIDIGEAGNIHPKNKREVGRRLSLWARARVYGESIPYSGPLPRSHTVRDGRIIITFGHADGGLVAQGGAVKGFEVAGADRRWVPAEASLQGDQVIVTSPQVPAPSAVRYAWADNPECNLFNGAGLPASPFRTDDGKP